MTTLTAPTEVDITTTSHKVQVAADHYGEKYMTLPRVMSCWQQAKCVARCEGRTVLDRRMTHDDFLKRFFANLEVEDLPGQDIYMLYIESRWAPVAFDVEVTDRRRNKLGSETIDPAGLEIREEKTFTIRLRGVAFNDVMSCQIVE